MPCPVFVTDAIDECKGCKRWTSDAQEEVVMMERMEDRYDAVLKV